MLHNVAFHQDPHCLLSQDPSSEKKKQCFYEIITYDPSVYSRDHYDFIVYSLMENSIGPSSVNINHNCLFIL